ncbi:ABC transporter ATP-binding protein [Sedimentitalea todarodis]|uniref:ABC transporter ATP-binding protein n=2 Tax=Sedimentitalea todarodis TaxID=1631240 RepID=A0ABU3VK65_9RHOB|nr:ABC transporter ATP-binding protein [Sedimentitalea todarodis]
MAIAHLLEDFSVVDRPEQSVTEMSDDAVEDIRLASFEQGYTAGWDDAIRVQSEDKSRVIATLAQNLEDFSFTYQEALAQMTRAVEPVFQTLMQKVLPEAMTQSTAARIVEQCLSLARDQIEQPVVLVVPVGAGGALKPILQKELPMQIAIRESNDIDPGQIQLRIGDSEREIDTDLLLASLNESAEAYYHTLTEDSLYG